MILCNLIQTNQYDFVLQLRLTSFDAAVSPRGFASKLLEYAGDPRQKIQKFDRNHSSIVCPSTPVNA